ncbi:MAG: hypothetical protein FD180_1236 [Planctomycetota bacterium]|nr:MAG: hypothetical protein FD180_1236 [Planctomycetota bacterium]
MFRMIEVPARLAALFVGVLLMPAMTARAEEPEAPPVHENDLADWDVPALSAGDWAEHELAGPSAPVTSGNKRPSRRLACVAVEEEMVWVEVTMKHAGKTWDGMVLSLGARKPDGKVTRACWGRTGATGTELQVRPPSGGPAVAPGSPKPAVTATGTVTKEKTKAGSTSYECEKIELETQLTSSCCDEKARITVWVSEKVPFRARVDEKVKVNGLEAETTWNGKPTVKGGVVKRQVSSGGSLEIMTLLRSGTDAREALARPDLKK